MRSLKTLAVAGLVAALPLTAAHAEEWYVSGKGGISFITDADGASLSPNADTQYDHGGIVLGAVGLDTGLFRYEGEFSWRGADVYTLGGADSGGRIDSYGLMGNLVMDFTEGYRLNPYMGLGVGAAYVDTKASQGTTQIYSGTDWVFAYQIFAGAEYPINENLSLGAEYRMFNTTEWDAHSPSGGKFDAQLRSHNVLVGLTYRLGEAPTPMPEPVAQPAPIPPSSYLVFFDWNKASITPVAREVLAKAASAVAQGKKAQVSLTGHTDLSGGSAYNMKLSMDRAEAVRNELASMGVSADIISLSAKGESDPLVQTKDGIREPQNRRVEILIP